MSAPTHPAEPSSNQERDRVTAVEPRGLRTFTPSLAVLAKSAGIYHWTPEGRRLFDFTSGVLVANLGHNPTRWLRRVQELLGWDKAAAAGSNVYLPTVPLTAYNAITNVERLASERLIAFLSNRPGGQRMEQVLWAASGSEAIQKALWAALARDPQRNLIVATRYGFHGKKGLAGATTGCESDPERDPRVRFVSF